MVGVGVTLSVKSRDNGVEGVDVVKLNDVSVVVMKVLSELLSED